MDNSRPLGQPDCNLSVAIAKRRYATLAESSGAASVRVRLRPSLPSLPTSDRPFGRPKVTASLKASMGTGQGRRTRVRARVERCTCVARDTSIGRPRKAQASRQGRVGRDGGPGASRSRIHPRSLMLSLSIRSLLPLRARRVGVGLLWASECAALVCVGTGYRRRILFVCSSFDCMHLARVPQNHDEILSP